MRGAQPKIYFGLSLVYGASVQKSNFRSLGELDNSFVRFVIVQTHSPTPGPSPLLTLIQGIPNPTNRPAIRYKMSSHSTVKREQQKTVQSVLVVVRFKNLPVGRLFNRPPTTI